MHTKDNLTFAYSEIKVFIHIYQIRVFKGVMNWEIKIPLIFWNIRRHCTIKNIL